ncbi:MAG: hypothetical protein D6806_16230 [Deltaproteobacteria bacterium]|nr:MAG: hypothetical protein D6806_16230 [Deltaproteobacteria bacterium]
MKRITLAAVAALVLSLASGALAFDRVSAGKLKGKPEIDKANCQGYYIWTDSDGLHIRWCAREKPLLFTGRLDTDRPVAELKRLEPKFGGWARTHGDRVVLYSSTVRPGDIDGIDLKIPRGRRVQFMLDVDGKAPEPKEVFLGAKAQNPRSLPLMLRIR